MQTPSESDNLNYSWTSPALILVATILGIYLLIKSLMPSRDVPANIPPFPAKPYPLLGHLPYISKSRRDKMMEWAKTAGEIYSIYFGPKLVIMLNSYDLAYQAFVKNADTLTDRPPAILTPLENQKNSGISTTSGALWREQRTVALQILRSFGMGKNILALKVQEEVAAYIEELHKLSGKPTNVRTLTNLAVSNVICSIIVGTRFAFDDAYYIEFLEILQEQVSLATNTSLFTNFRWLRYIPGDLFKAKKRMKNLKRIQHGLLAQYMAKAEEEYDENNLDNFISAYLYEMKKLQKQGKETTLDRVNLFQSLFHLFVGGSETTGTTIMWFLLYMLHFPDVQERIFQEIKDAVGTEKRPTMYDRTQLHYTNAAISETQRLASILPLGLPHYCTGQTVIKGYTIPVDATVMLNFDAVLWSSETWEDAFKFRPERFLDAEGKFALRDENVVFSLGRRACLGEALARMELFLFSTALVQRFELLPADPGHLPPREAEDGVTSPPHAFELRFVERAD